MERKFERVIRRTRKNFKNFVPTKGWWNVFRKFQFIYFLYRSKELLWRFLHLMNLWTLAPSSVDVSKTSNISTNSEILSNESPDLSSSDKLNKNSNELFSERQVQLNCATICYNRYDGKLVSANVINLSSCHLSKDEVSLPSKELKFVSTPKNIKKVR